MHPVRVDHCLFFINRDDTSRQIKIRPRESKIKRNDGLITLKYIPVSMKIVFLWVSLARTPMVVALALHPVPLTTPSYFIEESYRSTSREWQLLVHIHRNYIHVYTVCWCCVNHRSPINQHSIDLLRNVLRRSHAPSSKLAIKMDFCSSHVSLGKLCMY